MSKPKSDYTIQTVSNALRLLEAFSADAELGVSELSRRLGLHKNNVFRLLATLELGGYVEQSSESERYRLGVRCLQLGRAYSRSHTLSERARPVLSEFSERLGETAHLGVLGGFEVMHLDGIQHPQVVTTAARVGQRLPLHSTALGKVLLGCGPVDTLERFDREVVRGPGLEALTSATLVDGQKLFDELGSVAGQGFALDVGECVEGLHCAAAPVFGAEGQLVASLSVSAPCFRMSEDIIHREVLPVLTAGAAALSRSLGSPPSSRRSS